MKHQKKVNPKRIYSKDNLVIEYSAFGPNLLESCQPKLKDTHQQKRELYDQKKRVLRKKEHIPLHIYTHWRNPASSTEHGQQPLLSRK